MTYDKTTVEEVGDVLLIGEEHRNGRSAALAESVLEDVATGTIALEHVSGSGAIGVLKRHADHNGIPRVLIDGPKYFNQTVSSTRELIKDANHFEWPIEEDGDLDERAPQFTRAMIRDEYGLDTHREMYTERERWMARRLNRLVETQEAPIVAGVGAFHVQAIAEMLPRVGAISNIEEDRVLNPSPPRGAIA